MKATDHPFAPFARDADVCDTCGELSGSHLEPDGVRSEYREALWRAMLKHGGIPWAYDTEVEPYGTMELRAHLGAVSALELASFNVGLRIYARIRLLLKPCRIDWKTTTDPQMGEVGQFEGTEDGQSYLSAVVGELTCECRRYRQQDVALIGKTMGQLIWLVVKAGDTPPEGEDRDG